jgi:hypothetical protein
MMIPPAPLCDGGWRVRILAFPGSPVWSMAVFPLPVASATKSRSGQAPVAAGLPLTRQPRTDAGVRPVYASCWWCAARSPAYSVAPTNRRSRPGVGATVTGRTDTAHAFTTHPNESRTDDLGRVWLRRTYYIPPVAVKGKRC